MLLSRQAQAAGRLPLCPARRPGAPAPRRAPAVVPVAAAVAAPPASLDVKSFKDGSAAGGPATLALSVAESDTAGAVVHRYVVMLRQNARAVRLFCFFCLCRELEGCERREEGTAPGATGIDHIHFTTTHSVRG
jgi:hypothetical protein